MAFTVAGVFAMVVTPGCFDRVFGLISLYRVFKWEPALICCGGAFFIALPIS